MPEQNQELNLEAMLRELGEINIEKRLRELAKQVSQSSGEQDISILNSTEKGDKKRVEPYLRLIRWYFHRKEYCDPALEEFPDDIRFWIAKAELSEDELRYRYTPFNSMSFIEMRNKLDSLYKRILERKPNAAENGFKEAQTYLCLIAEYFQLKGSISFIETRNEIDSLYKIISEQELNAAENDFEEAQMFSYLIAKCSQLEDNVSFIEIRNELDSLYKRILERKPNAAEIAAENGFKEAQISLYLIAKGFQLKDFAHLKKNISPEFLPWLEKKLAENPENSEKIKKEFLRFFRCMKHDSEDYISDKMNRGSYKPSKKPEARKTSRLPFLIPAISLIAGGVVGGLLYFGGRKIETKKPEYIGHEITAPEEIKPSIAPVEPTKPVRAEPTTQAKAEIVDPIPSYEKRLEKIVENGIAPNERKELDSLFSELNKDKRAEKFKSSYQVFREKLFGVIKDYDKKLIQEKAKRKAEVRARKISEADQLYDKYQQDYFNWLKEGITAEERTSLDKLLANIDVLLNQYNKLAVSKDRTDLVLSFRRNIQKVAEAHDIEQRKVRQRIAKYASDLASARSKFSEGNIEEANQLIESLQKTLEKDTSNGLEQLLADVRNLNSEIDKNIELKAENLAKEEERLRTYFNRYDAVIANFNAKNYQTALTDIDSLIADAGKEKFRYENKLIKKLSSSKHKFQGTGKLVDGLQRYRDGTIMKKAAVIRKTVQDVERLLQRYNGLIIRGEANELIRAYNQTQALSVNLAKPPYQENEELRQKIADYNQKIHSRLLTLAGERKEYFRRRFVEIKNRGNNANSEAELRHLKSQISTLKRGYDVFRKSPLANME